MSNKLNSAEPVISFPIVGIGASAGGLEAISSFIKELTEDTGMAFVFIQHLDPKTSSSLVEILSHISKIPVVQITDGLRLKPNIFYIVASNTIVQISGGVFSVRPRSEVPEVEYFPIDYFLNSLAIDQNKFAIGVILSGSGYDGTAGVGSINAHGGITFAQSVNTCAFPSMPNTAINSGNIDIILSPVKIAEEIEKLSKYPLVKPSFHKILPEHATFIDKILFQVYKSFGVDFSQYKQSTVRRRIHRRMVVHQLDQLKEYFDFLMERPLEVEALFNDLLINVTYFFRDPDSFDSLKKYIFPKILENIVSGQPIRIWIPGCSTGEEAYSVMMTLIETLGKDAENTNVQIFATDISEKVIKKARMGLYSNDIVKNVSAQRLERFFIKVNEGYRISKTIRKSCVFAVHNVLIDPPFSKVDLVICRNLLIYFDSILQEKVVPIFHYALKPNGFLMLGPAESVGQYSNLFESIDHKARTYTKKTTDNLRYPEIPFGIPSEIDFHEGKAMKKIHHQNTEKENIEWVDRFLVNRVLPPGFVVNEDMEIIQIKGDTSPFVVFSPGSPSHNLQRILHQELRTALRAIFHEALNSGKNQKKDGIKLEYNGGTKYYQLQVLPIRIPNSNQKYFAILFNEMNKKESISPPITDDKSQSNNNDIEIKRLEQELYDTKNHLQEIIEELEVTNEELKSSSEEILSSNEELQSTNEELQTSKEEVQSANEELSTLNEELQTRNSQVMKVNNDLNNVLNCSQIPIIILGLDLSIRRFTPSLTKLFRILPTDIGRSISDIRPFFNLPDLEELTLNVIETMQLKKINIRDEEGHWYKLEIYPYRNDEKKIDGAVITFVDINDLQSKHEGERLLAAIMKNSHDAIIISDLNGKITAWNSGAVSMYGYTEAEALNMNINSLVPDFLSDEVKSLRTKTYEGQIVPDLDTKRVTKDGRIVDVWITIEALLDHNGETELITSVERDLTERKLSDQKFKSLLDLAPTAMVVTNKVGEIVLVNSDIEKLFGYKREELYGQKFDILLAEINRNESPCLRQNYSKDGEEAYAVTKDGKEFQISLCSGPIQTGDELLVTTSITDISDQKMVEATLTQARDISIEASKAKTDFLSNMSHEIRTPLSAILGFSELLSYTSSEDKRLEYIQTIQKSGYHLNQIVDDILDLAKVEAGKVVIENTRFPLLKTLHEIFDIFKQKAEAKKLTFNVEFKGNLPFYVISDETKLRQILFNIIQNAIKFTSKGSIIVEVQVSEDKLQSLEITIKDSGSGLSVKDQSKLFKPFTQADNSSTRKFGGTGLGLVLSNELAKAMGGGVSIIKSSPGKGSTFLIKITPKEMSDFTNFTTIDKVKLKNSGEQFTKQQIDKFAGKRMLIVEDNTSLQLLAKNMFSPLDIEIEFAENGEVSIVKIQKTSFDIILMDLQMPIMGGVEATKRIRESGCTTPIIAVTANVLKKEEERAMQAGCNDYILKPYKFINLVNMIEKYLN
jgi:two-component system CheB/CheR fusion protein